MLSTRTVDVIEKLPSLPAITDPRTLLPFSSSTVLPASAVPSIKGVLILVNAVVVVRTGLSGAVISNMMETGIVSDGEEILPA